MSSFIQDCINGEALLSEIDDYIDLWHASSDDIPLHLYLGMTKGEYALFIEDEGFLASIVTAHKEGKKVESIVREQLALAARSDNYSKSTRLEHWLKLEGLWE